MCEKDIGPGDTVKHFKGAYYRVLGVALNTETDESMVIYHEIDNKNRLFARPLKMFTGTVMQDGQEVPRFVSYSLR